jgi:hypothetical protein
MRAARLVKVVGGDIQIVLRSFPRPSGSCLHGPRLLDVSLSVLDCGVRPSPGGGQLVLAATLGCGGRTGVPFTRSNGTQVLVIPMWGSGLGKRDRTDRMGACGRTNRDAR